MRRFLCVITGLALAVSLPTLSGHGQEPARARTLMQRKLDHAQKVLEGVAISDFNLIAKHAEELIQISKMADWKVVKSPQYEVHSMDFRRAADRLVKEADNKNTDAAALAYVEMTLTCVKCHKYVREARMARLD
jgi:hypothetical protein